MAEGKRTDFSICAVPFAIQDAVFSILLAGGGKDYALQAPSNQSRT